MTDYPHKPFSDPPQPNDAKQRRQEQLAQVRRRRAVILGMMRRMKAK